MRKMKSESNKATSFNEDSKMLGLKQSTTIMARLESLEATNFENEKVLEQNDNTIKSLNERVKSLLEERNKLEGLLNQIDEAENHAEFEEYKQNVESKYEEEFRVATEESRLKIDELEHISMQKDLDMEKQKKENEKLEEKIQAQQKKIHNFEENYVSKVKFESVMEEVKNLKQKLSSTESTLTFRDMRIGELEKKVVKIEESRKREVESAKKKAEEKIAEGKRKRNENKKSLKDQIKELTQWKTENLIGEKVDPEYL